MNDETSDDLQIDLKNDNLSQMNHVQISLKLSQFSDLVHICMKNIDLFTYIIIDRYTSEMFHDIMIDFETSVRLIVDYEQYLAFIKNIIIDLNRIKTDTVNV
jgi:hypothetical protein